MTHFLDRLGLTQHRRMRFAAQCVLAAVCGLMLFWMSGADSARISVVVDMRSTAGSDGEIFYARAGEGYHPDRRVSFSISADGQWQRYRIGLPVKKGLARVRVDPGSAPGVVEIRSLKVRAPGNSLTLAGLGLASAVVGTNQMRAMPSSDGSLKFVAASPDPFVDFVLPAGAATASKPWLLGRWLLAALSGVLVWLLIVGFFNLTKRGQGYFRYPVLVRRLADRLSDSGALIVPPGAVVVAATMLLLACGYVAANLHQSSIGVWEQLFPAKPVAQVIDLGSPKHTRSDEWNTQTPWLLGQVASGENDENVSIGGKGAPLLAAVPLRHVYSLAQAKFYGFYLFDSETGFSWLWAYKSFGLLLAFFWLFLLLTKGDVVISLLGSAWVYGSSFTQWWLSSHLAELLIAFALATAGGYYLLFAHRKVMVLLGAVAISYACLNLMLHLYPPFIVPLAYLGAAILIGAAAEPGRMKLVVEGLRWRSACLFFAMALVGLVAGSYLVDAMPSIDAMASTSYPGKRVSAGGDMPLFRLMYGYFEAFRTGEANFPLPPTNASEASNFIILAPLLLLALPLRAFGKHNALLLSLIAYCISVMAWISLPLPGFLEAGLQKIGWAWSPPARSLVGLGIGSIAAIVVFVARLRASAIEVRAPWFRVGVCIGSLLGLLLFGRYLQSLDPAFFTNKLVVVGAVANTLLITGALFGRRSLMAVGLACAIAPALTVNPLVSGLSALNSKPILRAAKEQGGGSGDRWAVVGAFVFSQGLKSQGLEVLTGSQMIPNTDLAFRLDPQGAYKQIWNRYAHVALRSDPGRAFPVYELRSPDLYMIGADICSSAFAGTGVTRIAYTDPVPKEDEKCLVPLQAPADSGVRLFRYSFSKSGTPR